MMASAENNWFGVGQHAWDQMNPNQQLMQMMGHGFAGVNSRLDKLTIATCAHLIIDESNLPSKVFSLHPIDHSGNTEGVWTVVQIATGAHAGIYAMSVLHVPVAPVLGTRDYYKRYFFLRFPQQIIVNLHQNQQILVSRGALNGSATIADDFVLVQLKDDINLGDKLPLLVGSTDRPACHGSCLVVAHTARGMVSASLPECLDDIYTLSSQILQNGDSGATLFIENTARHAVAAGRTTWATADGTQKNFGSYFLLGLYQGIITVGTAKRPMHAVIRIPNGLESVEINGVDEDDGTVTLSRGLYCVAFDQGRTASFLSREKKGWPWLPVVATGIAAIGAGLMYRRRG